MTAGLNDWTIDKTDGRNILFYKGKNYIPRNTELRRELYKISMTMKQQDILEKLEHIMQYTNTIGGQDYVHSWKTMFRDVGYANNSKSTDHHRSRFTFLLKEQNHYGHLQIALWIWSWISHRRTDMTLFWSW